MLPPRIRALLGVTSATLDEAALQRLVEGGVPEAVDLDYKQEIPESREFAKDVAAMANAAGGLIVIGVAENETASAARLVPQPLRDDEEIRMRQIVAANVFPTAAFDVQLVASKEDGLGYYLVHVPPSTEAPHAVVRDKSLRYPKRFGTQTSYLAEQQVADAYRSRFAAAREQIDRLEGVFSDGRRGSKDLVLLTLALVPNVALAIPLDQGWLTRLQDLARAMSFNRFAHGMFAGADSHVAVGFRRVTVGASYDPDEPPPATRVVAHTDGAVLTSAILSWESESSDEALREQRAINREMLFACTADALNYATQAITNEGGFGDAAVLCGIRTSRTVYLRDEGPIALRARRLSGSRSLTPEPPVVRRTLNLDALQSPAELVIATRSLVREMGQAFGVLDEPFATDAGELRRGRFRGVTGRVDAWTGSYPSVES